MKRFALLLSLVMFSQVPLSKAEQAPQNTNIAGPTASATGSVVNQAVQVLQGPYPVTNYGMGVACPGPAMTVAPFVTGNINNNTDPSTYQSNSGSVGFTIGFSTPLNGTLTELCKESARAVIARNQAEADKAALDYELVRLLRCGEAIRAGIQFHPESPYRVICADVVVVQPPAPGTVTQGGQ